MRGHSFFLAILLILSIRPAISQVNPADGPWSGQIQCQLNLAQQGYSRREIQTWTLASSAPTNKGGDIRIYPATWTVSGQGALQRVLGTRSSLAQWNINVPPANTSIAMFVRAQDKQFIIRIWQRSAPSYTGISAMRQTADNGVPQQPVKVASVVQEWTLPWIQADPRETTRGKFSVATESLGADLTPPGAAPAAVCTYQFTRTASGSTATASNVGQSAGGSAADAKGGDGSAGGGAKVEENSQSGAADTSGAAAQAKREPGSQEDAAGGAKAEGDSQSGAADTSGAAAEAKQEPGSQADAGGGAKAEGDSQTSATDTSVTTNQKGSAVGSAGGGPSGLAGKAGSNPAPPGDGNAPIPTDTAGSSISSSQTCPLGDIASMYDRAGQNIELIFAKLTKEAETAKKNLSDELPKESLSASVASGDAQARERIKYLDQAIAQIPTVEQGAVQEVAKAKQKALEQIAKAPSDAERNDACQAAQSAATQLMTTVESEANALDAGISGAGGGTSGSAAAMDAANSKSSLSTPGTLASTQTSEAVASTASTQTSALHPSGSAGTIQNVPDPTTSSPSPKTFGPGTLPPGVLAIASSVDLASKLSIKSTNPLALRPTSPHLVSGGTASFLLEVSNRGPAAADGAVVSFPAGHSVTIQGVACSLKQCPTASELEKGWKISQLQAGTTITFTIESSVAAESGPLTLMAEAKPPSGVTDLNPSDNSATLNATVVPLAADLEVRVTPRTALGHQPSWFAYDVDVRNAAGLPADGAVVTSPAIAGIKKLAVSCTSTAPSRTLSGSATCPANPTVLQIEQGLAIPRLDPLTNVIFTIEVIATSSGTQTLSASATPPSGLGDPVTTNNSATAAVATVQGTPGNADVSLVVDPVLVVRDMVRFAVIVRNAGPDPASLTVIKVPAVAGATTTLHSCETPRSVNFTSARCPYNLTMTGLATGLEIPWFPPNSRLVFTIWLKVPTRPATVTLSADGDSAQRRD